jgi:hypothetical protein
MALDNTTTYYPAPGVRLIEKLVSPLVVNRCYQWSDISLMLG